MKKIIGGLLLTVLISSQTFAQQDPIYGQYIFNNAIINPAQAGVQSQNQFGILHRNQWLGINGAPTTNSMFLNMRLPKNLGLALGVYNDKIGPISEVSFQGDIASHVKLTENWSLSGGVRTMVTNMQANLTSLQLYQSQDPNFSANVNTGLFVNMGAGVLLYSDKYYFGASIPKIISKEIGDGNTIISQYQRHIFVYGGANFKLNEDFIFTPSVLFKTTTDAPLQFDMNFVFDYKNTFDVGPMLRSKDAIGFLAGYKINTNFYLGYMYEYPLSDIQLASRQTHEISLRVLWEAKNKSRIYSPRYFF